MAKRRSAKQRRASQVNILKAQKVSARKRRGRKAGILAVGGVAVLAGGAIAYRKYDRNVENAQHKHLSYKAWNTRVNKLDVEYDDDILHARSLKPHPQPRRYRNRPLSQQTKTAIGHSRKSVFGKAITKADRVITAPSPINISASARYHRNKQSGPVFDYVSFGRGPLSAGSAHVFGARVGNARASLTVRRPSKSKVRMR